MQDEGREPDTVDIAAWRKAQRAGLVSRRENVPEAERKSWNERISAHLGGGFAIPAETIVGFCWPYRGEYDARFCVRRWRDEGAIAALPEVTARDAPLRFRKWWPGAPMRRGVYGIPVPNGTEIVVPDILIVPMNAYDGRGFRLGYGGGFFDSTLEALARRVIAVGVSYEMLRVATIHPQTHDVPMDFVVTEAGIDVAVGAPLQGVDADGSRICFAALLAARRLPRATCGAGGYSSPACYAAEFPGYFGDMEEEVMRRNDEEER